MTKTCACGCPQSSGDFEGLCGCPAGPVCLCMPDCAYCDNRDVPVPGTAPDPQTAADAAKRVQRWLDAVREHGRRDTGYPDEDDVQALLEDRKRMAAELEQVRGDLARARDDFSEVWLAERGEEMRDALTVAAELIDRLADAGECKLTAEGLCWWHGATGPAPCPHPLAREFAEAWRTVQSPTAEKGPESP